MSWPSTKTRPPVGRSRPAAQLRSVDLPEPDGPMTAVKVPGAKARSTPARAATTPMPSPYVWARSRTSRAGALVEFMPPTLGTIGAGLDGSRPPAGVGLGLPLGALGSLVALADLGCL